jgi:predicted Zn-dependent protease
MQNEQHQKLGALLLDTGNATGAIREFRAVAVHNPIDPAEAYYQLARAYNATHRTEEAKDALLSALEAAPGYRPAQKLLLELNAAESSGTPPDAVRR